MEPVATKQKKSIGVIKKKREILSLDILAALSHRFPRPVISASQAKPLCMKSNSQWGPKVDFDVREANQLSHGYRAIALPLFITRAASILKKSFFIYLPKNGLHRQND